VAGRATRGRGGETGNLAACGIARSLAYRTVSRIMVAQIRPHIREIQASVVLMRNGSVRARRSQSSIRSRRPEANIPAGRHPLAVPPDLDGGRNEERGKKRKQHVARNDAHKSAPDDCTHG
jgi:hypothetical protein